MDFSADFFDVSAVDIAPAMKRDRKGQARHLDESQLAEIFKALDDDKWAAVFGLAYFTGSRIGEVLTLTVDQVKRDRIIINIAKSKTKKTREVEMVPALRALLDVYRGPDKGYLFPARHNGRKHGCLSRQSADYVLRRACSSIGLEGVSTHSFRRSFATNLERSGKSMASIQRLLGHTSAGMTSRYVG